MHSRGLLGFQTLSGPQKSGTRSAPLSQRSHFLITVKGCNGYLWCLLAYQSTGWPPGHSLSQVPVITSMQTFWFFSPCPLPKTSLAHGLPSPSFSFLYKPTVGGCPFSLLSSPLGALSLGLLCPLSSPLSFCHFSLLSRPSPVWWPWSIYCFLSLSLLRSLPDASHLQ